MQRSKRFGAVVVVGAAVMLGMAACGGGSDDETTTTTPAVTAAPQTIGNCVLQPNTNCAGANLAGANLPGVNLTGANMAGANLTGANLSGANLTDANFTGANLTAADLANAAMVNTNMERANLTQANFKGATITGLKDANAVQCETIRNDGSVNNASCPPASTVTTSKTPPTTAANPVMVCNTSTGRTDTLLAAYKSQADNFGLNEAVINSATANGDAMCANDGWASLKIKDSTGERLAVYSFGANGWQLVSVTGCNGTQMPEADRAGLC